MDETDSEVWQVHYCAPDEEFTTTIIVETDVDEYEAGVQADTRDLVLTRGGDIIPDVAHDVPFLLQGSDDGQHSRTVATDEAVAFAYFLHMLEMHGYSAEASYRELAKADPDWYGCWHDWQTSLSQRDRELRLLEMAQWRAEVLNDWATEIYLDADKHQGEWRSTNLSDEGAEIARQITDAVDVKPALCYRTAQQAALVHRDNHRLSDRIEYAEGIVLPSTGGQSIRHAWIEIDGEVAELTWPWHQFDGDDAVYLGRTAPIEDVAAARERDVGGSVFLSESQVKEVANRGKRAVGSTY